MAIRILCNCNYAYAAAARIDLDHQLLMMGMASTQTKFVVLGRCLDYRVYSLVARLMINKRTAPHGSCATHP